MEHRNIKGGVRIRRSVYIPPDLAARVDSLACRGVTASNAITVALRQALPTIEKKIEAGKQIPGLRIRKGK